MRNLGCLAGLAIVLIISLYLCKRPAPSTTELRPPLPTPTPLSSEKLKEIAMLVNSPKVEWLRSLGEPDRDLPPGNTLPRDAGETDWDLGTIEMDVSWLQTKQGILPWDIRFLHINGEPDASLLEMDLLTRFFGLSRSKSDDKEGDYEWSRPDGSVSAEYHKWTSGDPDLSGLHVYIEKPGGEPLPSVEERQKTR